MRKLTLLVACFMLGLTLHAAQNWKAVVQYDKQQTKADLSARLQKYAQQDSHALLHTQKAPSTKEQLSFAKQLAKELKHMGASNVQVSKTGIVTAEIAATTARPVPTLALMAHFDMPPQAVVQEPQSHTKYVSGNIVLNKKKNWQLTEDNSPQLRRAHGHDFLTSDGSAAFGADSKAGLAILMTTADYLLANPSLQHGTIKLVLLPDSASHAGAQALDLAALNAQYGYVLEGSDRGEITRGNFSGKNFTVVFEGRRDMPLGQANSMAYCDNLLMASDFHTLLPRHFRPETTAGQQGFIAVDQIATEGNRSTITGHIRAFTDEQLQMLTQQVTHAFNTVKAMNPHRVGAELTFQEDFQNVQSQLPAAVLQAAQTALRQEDIAPHFVSLRNQADFAVLTTRGLPSVGLFTGVFHGGEPLEYVDVDIMEDSLRGLLSLLAADPENLPTLH